MGKRLAISIGAAALGAAVIAAGASADFTSVHDPRDDTRCFHESHSGPPRPCSDSSRRRADIVRATAGHDGPRLRHTIRVVGKIESIGLGFNTDSDPKCEWFLFARRGDGKEVKFHECFTGRPSGRARVDFHLHSVEIVFRERWIGNPDGYGWGAGTNAGPWAGHANDQVRKFNHYYIRHELG
jgi:hypothetical protein